MTVGEQHLERRAANRAGDRAHDAKLGKLVVALRCEHKGWAAALLLVALGGVEVEPDDVTGCGAIFAPRLPFRAAAPSRSPFPAQVRQAIAPMNSGGASLAPRHLGRRGPRPRPPSPRACPRSRRPLWQMRLVLSGQGCCPISRTPFASPSCLPAPPAVGLGVYNVYPGAARVKAAAGLT